MATLAAHRRAAKVTYISRVLIVIERSPGWQTSYQLAEATGLTYAQVIFALNALNNQSKIARAGRKSTARWGRLALAQDNQLAAAFSTLDSCFRAFFSTPAGNK